MNRPEIRNQVLEVISVALGQSLPAGVEICRKSTVAWDSLKHVEIMFALEDQFSIAFTEEELVGLGDVTSIVEAIVEKNAT